MEDRWLRNWSSRISLTGCTSASHASCVPFRSFSLPPDPKFPTDERGGWIDEKAVEEQAFVCDGTVRREV